MWAYEEYSEWSRLLAESKADTDSLRRRLTKADKAVERAKQSHLSAVMATTSMQGQSGRRARTRVSLAASYEEANALRDAIELRDLFPEKFTNHA